MTSGKPGEVYLIYNFFPYFSNLGSRHHLDNNYEWGYLFNEDEDEELFSCAKIADSLNKLDEDYIFEWGKRFKYEVELVPAVQNPDGVLEPQMVSEPLVAAAPRWEEESSSTHARTVSATDSVVTPPSERVLRLAGPRKENS